MMLWQTQPKFLRAWFLQAPALPFLTHFLPISAASWSIVKCVSTTAHLPSRPGPLAFPLFPPSTPAGPNPFSRSGKACFDAF